MELIIELKISSSVWFIWDISKQELENQQNYNKKKLQKAISRTIELNFIDKGSNDAIKILTRS